MKRHIESSNVITAKGRVGAPPREVPPEIDRLMRSEAYWNPKSLDHQLVKQAVNRFFETSTPAPEQASVVNSWVDGKLIKRTEFRPSEDPRFTSRQGTSPEEIANHIKGA